MRMKEDAMGNGQLKPAFNLQQGNNCKTPLGERTKVLQVAKTFIKHRKEDLERIISDEGVLYRMNRSIQAEGSFGDIKQDMQFRRYLSKVKIFKTCIGLLKYANFWNIPFILINSNLKIVFL